MGPPITSSTEYRGLPGALQYLTFTRPDIAYVVQQVCLYMHDLHEPHFNLIKWILCYLKGTIHYCLQLYYTSPATLTAYSDANWAGCLDTCKSTSSYGVFLGANTSSLGPALRPSTRPSPMPLSKHASCVASSGALLSASEG